MPVHTIHRQHHQTTPELLKELEAVSYRPCPSWLGDFSFHTYRNVYGRDHGMPTDLINAEARKLSKLVLDQEFTTLFVQRYVAGQSVKIHRDPHNNLGHTILGIYDINNYTIKPPNCS